MSSEPVRQIFVPDFGASLRSSRDALTEASSATRRAGDLSIWRLAAFSGVGIPLAAALMPVTVYLPPFFVEQRGLSLAAVGAVFMLSRLWDAALDPVVGVLSDRMRRRKPWIIGGTFLFVLATIAIFLPPQKVDMLYLGFWLFAFYLGWTMISTPLYAWSGEITSRYHERSRVQASLQVATALGLLCVLVIPTFLDRQGGAALSTKAAAMGAFAVATVVPSVALLCLLFRERESGIPPSRRAGIFEALRHLVTNRLLARVIASDLAVATGQCVRGALFVFFVSGYMGRPEWAAGLFLVQYVFGVFAGPIWLRVSYRLGKSRTIVIAELLQAAINLSLLLVTPTAFTFLIALTIAQGLAQSSGNLMLRAIVSDVADAERLKTGQERSGLFFSIFNMTNNVAAAFAIGLALPLVGMLGFKPGAENSAQVLAGVQLVFALVPALCHTVSALLMWNFPLDERAHVGIRDALAAREASPHGPARKLDVVTPVRSSGLARP